MFWMTGVIFLMTVLSEDTILFVSLVMSELASPNPTIIFCNAALNELIDPSIVSSASAAVAPAMPMLS